MTSKRLSSPPPSSRIRSDIAVAVSILAVLAVPPLSVGAQQLPSSSEPGRLEQRFEQPATPQSKPEITFPAPEQAPPPEKAGEIRLTLHGVELEGNTVYSQAELKPLYENLLGREVSLLDLYTVRDAITAKYRNDGYILSQAVIPAQRINGAGLVKIRVIEGYINELRFEGGATDRLGLLQDYADKIKAARPLTASVLERYVLLIDDLAGVKARTVLEPVEAGGIGSNLTVVLEHKPVDASFSVDNRGTRAVGPLQMDGSVNFNDVLGLFDQTTVRTILTPQFDELRYVDVAHTEPVGLDGTTMTVGARRNWSEPGYNIRQFDIKSQGTTLRWNVMYPLIRSRSETLRLTGDLTYRNTRTNSFGEKLSDDRSRLMSVGASYDVADDWQGSNLFQATFHQGLDVLNATDTKVPGQSRDGAQPNFRKVTFSAQRYQPLPEQFGVLLATEGQFSGERLLSAEEYGVGGKLFGRAFDSSEITGDKGVSAKLEMQYTPDLEIPNINYIQFFTFYDYGVVWNYEDGPRHGRQSLGSAGGGIRLGLSDTVNGTFEFGKPMIRDASATGDRALRGFFSLAARY